MTFSFRPARRSEAKPLVGLYAQSGAGKTYSALMLARGFVGTSGRIAMLDSESGRGEAYADMIPGSYDVLPIRGDFSPTAYGEAVKAAEDAQYDALIIDSASHEWSGAGGVLSMAADNQAKGMKGVLVWQRPKMDHSRKFMLPLLQTPIPLVVLCLRAKYPMYEKKIGDRKEWVRSDQLEPDQADDILFELFVHGWLDQHHRLHVTKLTRPDLAQVFRDGELITVETGQRLAVWSKGDQPQSAAEQVSRPAADAAPSSQPLMSPSRDGAALSLEDQARAAARKGKFVMRDFWNNLDRTDHARINAIRTELNQLVDEAEVTTG